MKTLDCNQDAMAGFAAPYGSASLPPVLDACCGSRMFWFDRKDSRAVFVDKRRESHTLPDVSSAGGSRTLEINPDIVADFTELPFGIGQLLEEVVELGVNPHGEGHGPVRISWRLPFHLLKITNKPQHVNQND